MSKKADDPDLAGALAAMAAPRRGPRRTSQVYEWMAARYDGLAAAFRKKQPSWIALTEYLTEHGLTGADGKPASSAAVRSAWLRLDAAMLRKRADRSGLPVPRAVAPGASPVAPDADDDDKPDFGDFVR
jgi:hypothetical protein